VFVGFLNASGQIEPTYDARKVIGFKYYSAQGKSGPGGGLGYRWAFFGNCPSWREAGKPRDCGIVQSNNQKYLNTGYMWHPSAWTTAPAKRMLQKKLVENESVKILTRRLGRLPTLRDRSRLTRIERRDLEIQAKRDILIELPPISRLVFDGSTTDD